MRNAKKEKKEKGVLVLLTPTEREDFRRACKYFKQKQSTYLAPFARKLIEEYKIQAEIKEPIILPWET